MTVKTFVQPDYTSQSGTQYPTNIDAAMAVLAAVGAAFAPHQQAAPNMTVAVDAGRLTVGANVLSVAAQNTATIVAPTVNPRIDRIVIDGVTGVVSVVAGAEAASPAAPAVPTGKLSVAQVLLQITSTTITNSMLTDERALFRSDKDRRFTGNTIIDNANITISAGSIAGITDLAIADGGTGASSASAARTNLGLGALATLNSVPNGSLDGPALGFLVRADVSNLNGGVISLLVTDTLVTTVDLGSVVAGDRILVTAFFQDTGSTGVVLSRVNKNAGTATIIAAQSAGALYGSGSNWASVSGILKVTGSGTLTLGLVGSDGGATGSIAVNFGQLHAMVLKGG